MSCQFKDECPSYSGWCEGPKQDFANCVTFLIPAYKRLQSENSALKLKQPIQLDGDAAQSFALALESSRLKQENAKLRAQVEKLWLCLFCGEDAEVNHINIGGGEWTFEVRCPGCGCGTDGNNSREYSVSAWNTRAEPDNKPLTLDELRESQYEPVYMILNSRGEPLGIDGFWMVASVSVYEGEEWLTDSDMTTVSFSDYGETWLAYRRPPAADGEKG